MLLKSCAMRLGVLARADVLHRTGHPVWPALLVAQSDAALPVPMPRIGVMAQAVFDRKVRRVSLQVLGDRLAHQGYIIGVIRRAFDPLAPRPQRFARFEPQDLL